MLVRRLDPCHGGERGLANHSVAPLSFTLTRSRSYGCAETSRSFSKAAQPPGQSPRNSVLAGGGGTGCNRMMSQSLGASRTLGALGLSVICQEGRLGRSSPPGTSLQGQNASLAAPRSRFCVGPPGSPLLCSAASEPPFQVHLHSLPGHGSPGGPGDAQRPPIGSPQWDLAPRRRWRRPGQPWGGSSQLWPWGQSGSR